MKVEEVKKIIGKAIDDVIEEKATKTLTFSVIINQGGIRGLEHSEKRHHK